MKQKIEFEEALHIASTGRAFEQHRTFFAVSNRNFIRMDNVRLFFFSACVVLVPFVFFYSCFYGHRDITKIALQAYTNQPFWLLISIPFSIYVYGWIRQFLFFRFLYPFICRAGNAIGLVMGWLISYRLWIRPFLLIEDDPKITKKAEYNMVVMYLWMLLLHSILLYTIPSVYYVIACYPLWIISMVEMYITMFRVFYFQPYKKERGDFYILE